MGGSALFRLRRSASAIIWLLTLVACVRQPVSGPAINNLSSVLIRQSDLPSGWVFSRADPVESLGLDVLAIGLAQYSPSGNPDPLSARVRQQVAVFQTPEKAV